MSIAFVAHRGNANTKIAGMTLGINPNLTIPAGALLIVRCVSTNDAGAANGDSVQHSVTDSQGNIYTRLKEFAENTAADKLIVSVFASQIASALTTGDTVTLTTPTETVRIIALEEFSSDPGEILFLEATAAVSASTKTPSVSVAGLDNIEHLFGAVVGAVGPPDQGGAYIQDSDYSNNLSIGTTGAGSSTNRSSYMGVRVATLTGDTYNPTLGATNQNIVILIAGRQTITTPVDLATSGVYRLLNEDQDVQKAGTYLVLTEQDIGKTGDYNILLADNEITTQGAYRLLIVDQDVNLAGEYRIVLVQEQVKTGEYRIIQVFDVAKTGDYKIVPTIDIVKSGLYRITGETQIQVTGDYRILMVDLDLALLGSYRLSFPDQDISVGGDYLVLLSDREIVMTGLYRLLFADQDIIKIAAYRVLSGNVDLQTTGIYRMIIADNEILNLGTYKLGLIDNDVELAGQYVILAQPIVRLKLSLKED